MTEKEKMLAGLLYDGNFNESLAKEREACKELCALYNNAKAHERFEILKKILGRLGTRAIIEPHFWCDYGYNISVGENFYANHNLVILDPAKVEFGDNVFIGPNCGFYTAGHPLNVEKRNRGLEYARPIKVGNNVWFGGNVVVLPGVSIGDNVTIGAGSVVTKDIPTNVLAFGAPCRVIREINEND